MRVFARYLPLPTAVSGPLEPGALRFPARRDPAVSLLPALRGDPTVRLDPAARLLLTLLHVVASIFIGIQRELFDLAGVCLSRSTVPSGPQHGGISDEQLVTMWLEGDRRAFEALVRRYQHVAFTICQRYLNNRQLAEETAQDVFLSLYKNLAHFRGDASFKSWFYKVLANHCHNRHKAGVRRRQHLHDSIDTAADPDDDRRGPKDLVDERPDPERALTELERQALIERALQSISEESRMVLLLREGQGLAYEDVAASLGLNVGTVKSRIHRGRAELKAAVDRLMNVNT